MGNVGTLHLVATGNANVSGNVSASYFSGNGSQLTGVTAVSSTTAGTVSGSSQSNITSVGTLTSLSVTNGINGGNITSSGFVLHSVGTGISANGTTQSTATVIAKQINVITVCSSGVNDGVVLPASAAGLTSIIINATAANLKVYPAASSYIDSLAMNTPFVLGPGSKLMFVAPQNTQWYSLTGIYA